MPKQTLTRFLADLLCLVLWPAHAWAGDDEWGPEHPDVAASLENYAGLLRETGRIEEAEELDAHAEAIRAKAE